MCLRKKPKKKKIVTLNKKSIYLHRLEKLDQRDFNILTTQIQKKFLSQQ